MWDVAHPAELGGERHKRISEPSVTFAHLIDDFPHGRLIGPSTGAEQIAQQNAALARHREPGSEKRCSRCGEWLPVGEFRPNPRLKDGLHSWCRACCAEANREWRARKRAAKAEADTGPLVA
jgi:hypothetical protein